MNQLQESVLNKNINIFDIVRFNVYPCPAKVSKENIQLLKMWTVNFTSNKKSLLRIPKLTITEKSTAHCHNEPNNYVPTENCIFPQIEKTNVKMLTLPLKRTSRIQI